MRQRTIAIATVIVAAALTVSAPAAARGVQVSVLKSKQKGNMVLKVSGATQRPLRVTVPWGVAYNVARAAVHHGGLKVSTARDGFGGQMLRIISGSGEKTIILDRMRRAGPNGQTGAAALRYQRGLGKGAGSFFIARTRTKKVVASFPPKIIGTSGPSRRGASPMHALTLSTDLNHKADGSLHWYFRPSRSKTHDVNAPLRPFFYNGGGANGVTAKTATLVDAANILGR